jgi:hypothetical protein
MNLLLHNSKYFFCDRKYGNKKPRNAVIVYCLYFQQTKLTDSAN